MRKLLLILLPTILGLGFVGLYLGSPLIFAFFTGAWFGKALIDMVNLEN